RVGPGDLDDSEEAEDDRRLRRQRQVAAHERKEQKRGQDVAPGDHGLGRAAPLAAQRQDERGEEDAGSERRDLARVPAPLEPADEEEKHSPESNGDRGGIARSERLLQDEGRGEQHPNDAAVLEEDRVGRRSPLRREDEG